MRRSCQFFLFVSLVVTLVRAPQVRAQASGEISGTVSDPSQAVIPGAKITALQEGTALTRSTATSSAGTYSLPRLPVGTYQVTAERSGFKTATSRVTLDVNQEREVNFTLALAGTVTAVEVNATSPLLTTTNATLGGLVSGQQVSTLPLNGRDITNLVLLQPGVQQEVNTSFPFLNFVAGNGNRGTTGSSYMDNTDTSDNELGGAQFSNFNLDAIAEFKVLQNNYSAEYGRGSGAIVHLVTKSGTNEFHGSAFEFLRNSALDSRNFFTSKVPPFRRNEFGGTFGGPVRIPGVYNGRDRTFFFLQYAGYRQRRGEATVFAVPTADERKGIVDFVCDPTKSCSGRPGPDQYIVPLNPLTQQIANAYPLPNRPGGSFKARTFEGTASLPVNRDQWSARVDHRFSDKDSIFGRYTFSNNHQTQTSDTINAIENPAFPGHIRNDQRNAGLTETHIITPALLNTLRLGWTLTDEFIGPGTQTVTANSFSDGSLAYYGPDITIFDLHPATGTISDGVNWTKGRHAMTFGGEFRRVRDNEYGASVGGPNGYFQFAPGTALPLAVTSASGTNNLPAGAASPDSLISFLEGAAAFYQRTLAYPGFGPAGGGFAPFGVRRWHAAGWFQDDFKATRKLTLNLGLRYEYNSVPVEVAGRLAGIVDDPTFQGGKLYRKMVLNPDPIYFPDYRGWGPRFGLAYKLADKTVLRGGFGVFTNLPLTQTADQQAFNFPFAGTAALPTPPYSLTPLPVSGLPVLTDLNGNPLPPGGDTHKIPPNTPVNLAPVLAATGAPLLTNLSSMNLRNGYTMAGNFTLEQQLPGDVVFQVGYVTNNAAKLYASEWPNGYGCVSSADCPDPQFTPYTLANPGLGEFQLTDNHAHSTYHSMQAMVRKVSARHGIQFQTSYTWSKSIDNATTVFNGPGANSAVLQNNPFCWRCEKAASSFDFPQRFVANFTYELPLGQSQALSFVPRRLVQGWEITGIIQAQSGFPFTVNTPNGTVPYGTDVYAGGGNTRPDLTQQPTLKSGGGPEEQFFSDAVINNPQQFFDVPLFTYPDGNTVQTHPGNLGRNTFRTHAYSSVDFSLLKDTRVTERTMVQFRAEFFNLFNQHAFQAPAQILGSPGFGIASATVLPERQIQFGLRFIF